MTKMVLLDGLKQTIAIVGKGAGASAKGFVSVGGFTVLAGSIVSDHTVPSLETGGRAYFHLKGIALPSMNFRLKLEHSVREDIYQYFVCT